MHYNRLCEHPSLSIQRVHPTDILQFWCFGIGETRSQPISYRRRQLGRVLRIPSPVHILPVRKLVEMSDNNPPSGHHISLVGPFRSQYAKTGPNSSQNHDDPVFQPTTRISKLRRQPTSQRCYQRPRARTSPTQDSTLLAAWNGTRLRRSTEARRRCAPGRVGGAAGEWGNASGIDDVCTTYIRPCKVESVDQHCNAGCSLPVRTKGTHQAPFWKFEPSRIAYAEEASVFKYSNVDTFNSICFLQKL